MSSSWLREHRENITSQFGEDGIIRAIFERIGTTNKWCCELGAWDGRHLSNTYSLRAEAEWSAVLIEGDPIKFERLQANTSGRVEVITQCRFVSDVPPDTLDHLLGRTPIPVDFDLLSIDVDNDEYLIWRALQNYWPRVVVIEVNSYLPPDVEKIPRRGQRGRAMSRGASIKSMVELAKQKGYELAIHTGNCVFVRREYVQPLEIEADRWQELFDASWIGAPEQGILEDFKTVLRPVYAPVLQLCRRR